MKTVLTTLKFPEGEFYSNVILTEYEDIFRLREIYTSWRELCNMSINLGFRANNIPDILGISLFCIQNNALRIPNKNKRVSYTFNCYKNEKCIQVRSCATKTDLTSFGKNDVYDIFVFIDFYRKGEWDGSFDIYEIPAYVLYEAKVNSTKSLAEQQQEGKTI